MKEFKFPDVGEGITEAEIIEWLVKEGESVREDQNIVRVETDKAIVELPSPATGTINKIYKQKGDIVKVGETLVDILDMGSKPESKPIAEAQGVVGTIEVNTGKLPPQTETKQTQNTPQIKILPNLRKKAEEQGIDLTTIKGSGKDGSILARDLEGKLNEKETETITITKKYDLFGYIEHVPLKGLRKKIAENMELQSRVPAVTHMDEAYIDRLVKVREEGKKKITDTKLTYLPFIMKALIAALKDHPSLNSTITENEIILKKYYNIGIAVATPDGLLVPVVKGADEKDIPSLAKEIEGLAEKARDRTLDIMDMKGGTFTITNVGSIGGLFATPIINPGECAILAVGKMYDKVIAENGKTKIVKALPLSLTFDHRIADGAEAAQFTNTLIKYLEDPSLLLIR